MSNALTALQRKDIDDNFSTLRRIEDKVNQQYYEDMPLLLDEMERLLQEQKRILSGYNYNAIANGLEEDQQMEHDNYYESDSVYFMDHPNSHHHHQQQPQHSNKNTYGSYYNDEQDNYYHYTGEDDRMIDETDLEHQISLHLNSLRYNHTGGASLFPQHRYGGMSSTNYMQGHANNTNTLNEGKDDESLFPVQNLAQSKGKTKSTRILNSRPNSSFSTTSRSRQTTSNEKAKSTRINSVLPAHTIKAYKPMKFIPNTKVAPKQSKTILASSGRRTATPTPRSRSTTPLNSRPASARARTPVTNSLNNSTRAVASTHSTLKGSQVVKLDKKVLQMNTPRSRYDNRRGD